MIEDDVRTALLPAFPEGLPIIFAHGNGPRPAGAYVTLRIETANRLPAHTGRLSAGAQPADPGVRQLAAHRQGNVEIQCYGLASYDTLDAAMLRLDSEACQQAAEALNIAFSRSNRIQDVPALLNESTFEPRALVTLDFAYTRAVDESVQWIETVEAEATLDDLPPIEIVASIS